MYNDKMGKAFHAIKPPKNFSLTIYDNLDRLVLLINPKDLTNISDNDKIIIGKYIQDVVDALVKAGAPVEIVREALEE